jgi:hypothetical protein
MRIHESVLIFWPNPEETPESGTQATAAKARLTGFSGIVEVFAQAQLCRSALQLTTEAQF